MRLPPTEPQSEMITSDGIAQVRAAEPERAGDADPAEQVVDQPDLGVEEPDPEQRRGRDAGVSVGRKKSVRKMVVPLRPRLSSSARPSEAASPSGTTSAAK